MIAINLVNNETISEEILSSPRRGDSRTDGFFLVDDDFISFWAAPVQNIRRTNNKAKNVILKTTFIQIDLHAFIQNSSPLIQRHAFLLLDRPNILASL